jgi:hypothetical protein
LQAQAAQAAVTEMPVQSVQPGVAQQTAIAGPTFGQSPLVDIQPIEIEPAVVIPPTSIRGRYPELLELYDKGRSVEQIAKAMGLNKGEVQLILQLARREEEQHA